MGGTLIRLADHGHEVHVAYQTSGNIAVFDDDAIRFADFVAEFNTHFDVSPKQAAELEAHVEEFLRNKKPGQVDSPEVQTIKGMIRRGEARAATRSCGLPDERLHFMDMPFYETGRVKKKPLGEEDIAMVVELLRKIRPHQIYAAGDLSDPHGTHRVCLNAVLTACHRCQKRRLVRRLRSVAVSRRMARVGAARNRNGRAAEPDRSRSQADRDLQAPVAKGPGTLSRPRHARVLEAGRGPQPRHGPAVRQAGAGRVRGN